MGGLVGAAIPAIGRVLVQVAIGMVVSGVGMYLSQFTARWSYRNAPQIMRWVEPIARFGPKLILLAVPVMAVGVVMYNR